MVLRPGPDCPRARGLVARGARWLTGDRETAPAIWLEKQVFLIRWLGIGGIVPVLLALPMPGTQRGLLLGIVGCAALGNVFVPWLLRYRPDQAPVVTMSGDTVAAGLFLLIVGFNSALYMVLFTVVVASALRAGLRPALRLVAVLVILDGASGLARGDLRVADLVFRSAFLAVVAFLAAILYHYAKQGEARLRRVNGQLEQANRDLRQLDEAKSAFLSNVSHELRTPLASIRAYAELLLTYDDPAVAREFVEIIHGESERLTQLVGDVLDLMKIEAGKMEYHLQPLDLAPLIEEVGRVYAPLLARENVAFDCVLPPDLPPVHADPGRLRQVVGNLLSNALKFTPGGSIRLSVGRVGDEIQVAVSDTGVGIAVEDQERIFERFQQAGSVLTDKPRGTGLGLAICRDIVAHHGGRIWVESRPGVGSTFTFTLQPSPVLADAGGDHDEIKESRDPSGTPRPTRVPASGRSRLASVGAR